MATVNNQHLAHCNYQIITAVSEGCNKRLWNIQLQLVSLLCTLLFCFHLEKLSMYPGAVLNAQTVAS